MPFDPNAGSQITLEVGAAMTAKYRQKNPDDTIAQYYGATIITQILRQDGCVGIRSYYGLDPNNNDAKVLVMVGVDSNGNDITGFVADKGAPCPSICSNQNELNS